MVSKSDDEIKLIQGSRKLNVDNDLTVQNLSVQIYVIIKIL